MIKNEDKHNKVKRWFQETIKRILKIVFKALCIASLIGFATTPFLPSVVDHGVAQWIWYPSGIFFFIITVIDCLKNKEPVLESPEAEFLGRWGFFCLFPIWSSIFVFNYYDIDVLWLWIIFIIIAITVPFFFFSLFIVYFKSHNTNKSEHQTLVGNMIKYIFLYWFLDLLYLSIFNHWLVPTFVFGIISLVMISFNLVDSFLHGATILRFFIALELVLGLCLSGYLIYIIPDETLQNIVLSISAALIGGIFTLLGVAWTIKKGDADRQADLWRIEEERKVEERKKHIPFIKICFGEQPSVSVCANIHKWLDFENAKDRSKCINNVFYSVHIEDFDIKNISDFNIIVKGIRIDDKYFLFDDVLLERNATCRVHTTENWSISLPKEIASIYLVVCDILDNSYEIECRFHFKPDTRMSHIIATMNDGEEFTGFSGTYTITNSSLPRFIIPKEENDL